MTVEPISIKKKILPKSSPSGMRTKIFFFILFFYILSVFAQEGKLPPPIIATVDSSGMANYKNKIPVDSILSKSYTTDNNISPKKLETDFRNKYKGNEYDYTTVKPKESFWQKIVKRIKKILRAIFGDTAPKTAGEIAQTIFRILAIIIIALVLYFLISYLMSKEGNFIFGKKNEKINIEVQALNENIHEINFPESISEFERKNDYRSAVRYQFLYVLKKLSDKKLIDWNPEKTNKDYENEFKNLEMKDGFSNLSYIFNYVWYGEFKIDKNHYSHFKKQFQNFKL